ncbi:MAG: M15 family metallopeptidase, partial [Lachnospiraceae bacterium]|nr:M15 family metallopeptidase [Lachnospiraceae bacterium]
VMVPDSSEHQIGLSLDIVCDTYGTLTQGFGSCSPPHLPSPQFPAVQRQ